MVMSRTLIFVVIFFGLSSAKAADVAKPPPDPSLENEQLCEKPCPKLEYHEFRVDSVQRAGVSLNVELTDLVTGERAIATVRNDDISLVGPR